MEQAPKNSSGAKILQLTHQFTDNFNPTKYSIKIKPEFVLAVWVEGLTASFSRDQHREEIHQVANSVSFCNESMKDLYVKILFKFFWLFSVYLFDWSNVQ